jgi:hypothetical protein
MTIRTDGDLPLYTDIYGITIVTVSGGYNPDLDYTVPDKYFTCTVGQNFHKSGMTITKIVYNDNWLKEKGINRYEVFARNQKGAEVLWQWFDNPVSVNVICDK